MNDKLGGIIKKIKNPKILIIVGICGILLIFLSTFFDSSDKTSKSSNCEFSEKEYQEQLEDDIKEIVRNITGDKKASVVVTLESSIVYSYADIKEESTLQNQDNSYQNETNKSYVTIKDSSGNEKAVLITAEMPTIRGVAIVCLGGDNEIINQRVVNAVTAALNITTKRVYICGRKH